MASSSNSSPFVSRGGLKLDHALRTFALNPTGFTCVDLGCNVGGFTDCLLQHGAAHVFAVDTGYGQLAWKLRQDPRVTVLERTNALHTAPTGIAGFQPCDLAVIDLGWTRQQHAIPIAMQWLKNPGGRIVTLIKPQYEQEASGSSRAPSPVLADETAQAILERVLGELGTLATVEAWTPSPIRGGGSRRKSPGNIEYLALLTPHCPPQGA